MNRNDFSGQKPDRESRVRLRCYRAVRQDVRETTWLVTNDSTDNQSPSQARIAWRTSDVYTPKLDPCLGRALACHESRSTRLWDSPSSTHATLHLKRSRQDVHCSDPIRRARKSPCRTISSRSHSAIRKHRSSASKQKRMCGVACIETRPHRRRLSTRSKRTALGNGASRGSAGGVGRGALSCGSLRKPPGSA